MSSQHINTRRKIKEISEIKTFEDLIGRCILSEDEKQILNLHYLQEKDFRYIGDVLGFAESTIKKKHGKILKKLNKIL